MSKIDSGGSSEVRRKNADEVARHMQTARANRSMKTVSHRRSRVLASLATLAIQIAALTVFVKSWSRIDGFPLDDAWIHQVIARTFAQTGTLGYVPERFGSGATSYLWAALLAPNYAVLHIDPVKYTIVLTLALWLVTGQALLRLLLAHSAESAAESLAESSAESTFDLCRAAITAGLACAGGNFLWFAFSGMEATLFALLSITVLACFSSFHSRKYGVSFVAGACLFALVLTRPESAAFGVWLGAWALWMRFPKKLIALAMSGWALGVVTYATLNLTLRGDAFPSTLEGRKWLWLSGDRSQATIAADVPVQWMNRLRDYTLGTQSTLVFWLCVGVAGIGFVALVKAKVEAMTAFVAGAFLHLVFFLVFMPAMGHGGRYQPLIPLVFVALVTYGAITIGGAISHFLRVASKVLVPTAFALPVVLLISTGLARWREAEPLAVAHIQQTEVGLAAVFNGLPKDAVIASFDVGGAGFFSRRRLLDLGGITDSSIVPYLKDGTIPTYLKQNHVDYIAVPLGYDDHEADVFNFGYRLRLFENPGLVLEPVASLGSPLDVWLPGISSTMHSAPRQGIYRVIYVNPPAPPTSFGKHAASPGAADKTLVDAAWWGLPLILAMLGVYLMRERRASSNAVVVVG